MKSWYFTAVVVAVLALGTAVLWTKSNNINIQSEDIRHPLTDSLREGAERQKLKSAHDANLPGVDAADVQLSSLWKYKPALLIFTLTECPCSMQAQPFFNSMANAYGEKINFLAVTKGSKVDCSNYRVNLTVSFPMARDEHGEVAKAYDVPNSAYSALIGTDGKITKLWPGYSKKLLTEINETLAKTAGVEPIKLDLRGAPDEDATGCSLQE
ncbi:MAG: redoxin domain-containing protein [Armatimonadetes bacterium]|nr:redoxin domain-containing protein [Armatimonadota bacterium]